MKSLYTNKCDNMETFYKKIAWEIAIKLKTRVVEAINQHEKNHLNSKCSEPGADLEFYWGGRLFEKFFNLVKSTKFFSSALPE